MHAGETMHCTPCYNQLLDITRKYCNRQQSHINDIIIIILYIIDFPIVIIFFRGCVPEMFVTSYSVTYCIYAPEKTGICFHYYCAVYDECEWSDTFWLADRTRLYVQYTISLSSLCKLIWRHWTYKMPVRYILSSVWVRLNIFSQLSFIQYVGLCVFSLIPISLVMIERIYILCFIIIIKSEIWVITHCLGLGHETMVCVVCLSIFLWTWTTSVAMLIEGASAHGNPLSPSMRMACSLLATN